MASRNVLLESELLWDCWDQCEAKGLDILLGVEESLQVVQNQDRNIQAMKYSYGLFCPRLRVEQGKTQQQAGVPVPLAVPDIPQLQPTTWHRGSINQERLHNRHRIPGKKKFKRVCTQNPHCPVRSLLLCTSCFCEQFSAYPQTYLSLII